MAYSNPVSAETNNLHQLDEILSYISQQLINQYPIDHTATALLRQLQTLKEIRRNPEGILKYPTEADQFSKIDPSSDSKKRHPAKSALVYLLKIAFCDAFPENRKDADGKFKFIDSEGRQKLLSKAEENQLIPTSTGFLNLPSHIIKTPQYFVWQDQIRAIYHARDHIPSQGSITIQKDPTIDEEIDLKLSRTTSEQKGNLSSLSLDRIDYYYEMIHRAATQKTIRYWDDECKKDKNFSDLVVQVCRYSTMLRKKNDRIDETQRSQLESIRKHSLSTQYLQVTNKTRLDLLQKPIERFLDNLASPLFLKKGILGFSDEQRVRIEALRSRYEPLAENPGFEILLKKIDHTKDSFFEAIENGTIEKDTIDHLQSPGVLFSINSLTPYGLKVSQIIFSPGELRRYRQTIERTTNQAQRETHSKLGTFIEDYNTREMDQIELSEAKDKKALNNLEQELAKICTKFDTLLATQSLAKEVLYNQHGCNNLIDALDKYGDLAQRLQDKKFEEILLLAKCYYFNAQSDIILNAIQLSELPLGQALAFSDTMRAKLGKYHQDLLILITSRYTLDPTEKEYDEKIKDSEKYIYQHLNYMLAHHVHNTQDLIPVLEGSVNKIANQLLIGLVQRKILTFDEIFTMGDVLLGCLYGANERYYKNLPSETQKKVEEQFVDLADIISQVPALAAKREKLDQLKASDTQEQYESARKRYFSALMKTTDGILNNLQSPNSDIVKKLTRVGFSFPEAITTSSEDYIKIQEKYKVACTQWKNHQSSPLFQEAKINSLDGLAKRIKRENPHTKPKQIFANVCQTIQHASSLTIQNLYQLGLLTIGNIATLTPSVAEYITQNKQTFLLQDPILKKTYDEQGLSYLLYCLKYIFRQPIEKTSKITDHHIQNIIQNLETVSKDYFANPLLKKIVFKEKISPEVFVDAVQAFDTQHQNNQNSWGKKEEEWKKRFLKRNHSQKRHSDQERQDDQDRAKIIKNYDRRYDDFLYSAFKFSIAPNQPTSSFSLQDLAACCERALDNLDSPTSHELIRLEFNSKIIFTSTQEQRDYFFVTYEALKTTLENLKLTPHEKLEIASTLNVQATLEDFLHASIKRHDSSLIKVTHDTAEAVQKARIQNDTALKGLLPLTTAMLLPTSLLTDTKSLLETMSETLPESYKGFYTELQRWFEKIDKDTPLARLQQSINILKCPISIELYYHGYSIDMILATLTDQIGALNAQIEIGDSNDKIKTYITAHSKYESFSHLMVDCFKATRYPLKKLPEFLETRIQLFQEHSSKIEKLAKHIPLCDILSVDLNTLKSLDSTRHRYRRNSSECLEHLQRKIDAFHNPSPGYDKPHRDPYPVRAPKPSFFKNLFRRSPQQSSRRHRPSR